MDKRIIDLIKYAIDNNSISASYENDNFGDRPLIQYVETKFDTRDGECYRVIFIYDGGHEKVYSETNESSIIDQLDRIYNWTNGIE